MKAAIMQPYFFPYIGYFQLIAAVDRVSLEIRATTAALRQKAGTS